MYSKTDITMYYRFTDEEYADIVLVYGYCNGNARAAAREYQQRFSRRMHPCHSLFTSCFRRFRTTGCARPPCEGRGMMANVDAEERILDALRVNPRRSTRRIATGLRLSQSFVWRVACGAKRRVTSIPSTGRTGAAGGGCPQEIGVLPMVSE